MLLPAIVGLICFAVVTADVRDVVSSKSNILGHEPPVLAAQSFSRNNIGHRSNNGQIVKNYNAGNTQSSSNRKRYWWMDTGSSPFRTQYTFDNDEAGSNNANTKQISDSNFNFNNDGNEFKCFSDWCRDEVSLNFKHNTQQQQHKQTIKRNHYSQNPFLANLITQPSNNIHTHTSISGSPSEVNSLLVSHSSQSGPFGSTFTSKSLSTGTFSSGRIPCTAPGKICAPKHLCNNGYISESQLELVSSQDTVSYCQLILSIWWVCAFTLVFKETSYKKTF